MSDFWLIKTAGRFIDPFQESSLTKLIEYREIIDIGATSCCAERSVKCRITTHADSG
jgi:hypothetical protein